MQLKLPSGKINSLIRKKIKIFFRLGYRHIDSAANYGNEKEVKKALNILERTIIVNSVYFSQCKSHCSVGNGSKK